MKALAGAFNQEKALVGAFSVLVKTSRYLREPKFEALIAMLRRASSRAMRNCGHCAACSSSNDHINIALSTEVKGLGEVILIPFSSLRSFLSLDNFSTVSGQLGAAGTIECDI